MRDEKGFSLIELIVTVALMALLMTGVFIGLGALTGMHARECANDLDTALDQAKNYALTKSGGLDAYMELSKEADGYYVTFYVPDKPVVKPGETASYVQIDRKKVGNASVKITCRFKGGANIEIGTSTVKFYYDRISGAFKEAEYGVGFSDFCQEIRIKKHREYVLKLVPATGKHTLTRES